MVFRFKQWRVYGDIRLLRRELRLIVNRIDDPWERREMGSQIRRAIFSAMANLAEGSFRGTDKDFAAFVNRSVASMYEVVSALDALADDGVINESECLTLQEKSEAIVRQLVALQSRLTETRRIYR